MCDQSSGVTTDFIPNRRALSLQAQERGKAKVIAGTRQHFEEQEKKKKKIKTLASHSTYKSLLFLKEFCEGKARIEAQQYCSFPSFLPGPYSDTEGCNKPLWWGH